MKKIIFAMLLILLVSLFGCTNQNQNNSNDNNQVNDTNQIIVNPPVTSGLVGFSGLDDSELTIQALNDLILANNSFAVDYYNKLDSGKNQSGKNLFFSPFSISTALAMTYEGADGLTAQEMRNVFYFSENDDERRAAFANVYNNLNESALKGNYKINIANALWNEQTYTFKESFYDTVKNYYYGKSTPVDFINAPEEQRLKINSWVEDQTNKKIIELLPEKSILDDTRMVLVNAIYFKGDWNTQFKKEDTKENDFFVSEEETTIAQMMYQNNNFNYYENDSFQYVELPYKGGDLSMIIGLPTEIYSDCGEELTDCSTGTEINYNFSIPNASELLEVKSKMSLEKVEIYLPKFKFNTAYKMSKDLKEMGMLQAFSNNADFSKMDERRETKIDEIYHQAFVEVNEEGTEAAAATAIVMVQTTAVMPEEKIIVNANHPFFFYIQDNVSGEILFLGKIVDPTLE